MKSIQCKYLLHLLRRLSDCIRFLSLFLLSICFIFYFQGKGRLTFGMAQKSMCLFFLVRAAVNEP